MVLFYETSEKYVIYMGRDKYENEELIKFGLPTDYWFHVDDMSSAHVYLRMKDVEETIDTVSAVTINECAALVKANSIEGCKKHEVTVIYTPWANLNKTSDMTDGAIGFHDRKKVTRVKIGKNNPIVNALNRSKREETPDLYQIQADFAAAEVARGKERKKEFIKTQEAEKQAREEEAKLHSYASLHDNSNAGTVSNADFWGGDDDTTAAAFEDDFM